MDSLAAAYPYPCLAYGEGGGEGLSIFFHFQPLLSATEQGLPAEWTDGEQDDVQSLGACWEH